MKNSYRLLATAGLALALAAGCVSLKREYPQRKLYSLGAGRAGSLGAPETGPTVRIQPFRASSGLESTEFVYRTGESSYETDFYYAFFTFPADQVQSAAVRWLKDSGKARVVLGRMSSVRPDYVVEGNLSGLHGDFRDKEKPQAVIEAELLLIDNRPLEPLLLFGRTYRQSKPIGSATPDALVKGWEEGLSEILAAFEKDFSAALERPPAPSE
jgi:ABC-type uncharacterized transport system auxiliary subunit